jgi:predicted aconitase
VSIRYGALQDGFEKILEAGLTASDPEMQIDVGNARMPWAWNRCREASAANKWVCSPIIVIGCPHRDRELLAALNYPYCNGRGSRGQRVYWCRRGRTLIEELEQVDDIVAFLGRVFHEFE